MIINNKERPSVEKTCEFTENVKVRTLLLLDYDMMFVYSIGPRTPTNSSGGMGILRYSW